MFEIYFKYDTENPVISAVSSKSDNTTDNGEQLLWLNLSEWNYTKIFQNWTLQKSTMQRRGKQISNMAVNDFRVSNFG